VPISVQIKDHNGQRTSLTLQEARRYRIGRAGDNEIVLLDPGLSRRHAELWFEAGEWKIADLGSSNGTFLDDVRLATAATLTPGARIRFGGCRLGVEGAGEEITTSFAISDHPLEKSSTLAVSVDQLLSMSGAGTDSGVHRTARELELLRRRFEVVQKATLELLAHQPPDLLLPKILDLALGAVKADRAALVSVGQKGQLQVRSFRGKDPLGFTISQTIARRVLDEKVAILAADIASDTSLAQAQSVMIQGVRGVMAVPLWNNVDVMGLIYADVVGGMQHVFTTDDLNVLTMLGNIAAIHLENARLFEEQIEKRRFEREAMAAAEIQARLLPQSMPHVEGYEFFGQTTPCHEVGGDYFDALEFGDGRLGLILADVAGKGMGAALLMACLQSTYHACAEAVPMLDRLHRQLNVAVCRSSPSNRFITAFVADLDLTGHRLTFVNAGHAPPPLIVRADGRLETLMPGGPPLGVFPDFDYKLDSVSLEPGDFLFAASDGLTDVMDPAEEMFGEERLHELLSRLAGRPVEEVHGEVLEAVRAYAAGERQPDDLTMLLLRRLPAR
jgi:sigma-B regulation protein RsbU (phosphoserine phosphatase)